MIVSIHIPKTAGKSLRLRLAAAFGRRMLCDYGDWIGLDTPEARAQRAAQAELLRARLDAVRRDYDIVYGQFIADKYVGLFESAAFTAFVRDPYQQAVSHYQFLLRHPELKHPWVRKFHELRPSLPEVIAATPNFQSIFLGSLELKELAMVGLTEQYDRSVALFESVFGLKLPPEAERGNVNPGRLGAAYAIDPAVRKAIDVHRAADVELYQRAREAFARLAARHGV
jgi:hypothetical protein